MLPSACIETAAVSYLTGGPSGSVVAAAKQVATAEWWSVASSRFRLVTSELVVSEAQRGEAEMARRRLDVLSALPLLGMPKDLGLLAARLVARGLLPAKAAKDAMHICLAAHHDVALLVTWNFKHIANPSTRMGIAAFLAAEGYRPPLLCAETQPREGGAAGRRSAAARRSTWFRPKRFHRKNIFVTARSELDAPAREPVPARCYIPVFTR